MRADGEMNMCEQGVLRGEAGGRVRGAAGPRSGVRWRVGARDQRAGAREEVLRAAYWLRGAGSSGPSSAHQEDVATSVTTGSPTWDPRLRSSPSSEAPIVYGDVASFLKPYGQR